MKKLQPTKKSELIAPPNSSKYGSPFKYLIVITFTVILTILTLGCNSETNSSIDKTQITGSISYQDIQVDYGNTVARTAKLTNMNPSNATNSDYSYSANPPLPNGVTLNLTNGTITVENNAPGFSNTYLITATVSGNDPQYKGSVTGTVSIKVNHFSARSTHSVVEFNDELYLIGGFNYKTSSNLFYYNDVWKSSDGATWTEVTTAQPKFSERAAHSVVKFNNELYLIGGQDAGNDQLNDVWKSPDGATWTEVTDQAQFSGRRNHSVVVFNNELYLIGGYDSSDQFNDVWKSLDGATWTEVTTAQSKFSERNGHSVVVFNNELYLIGGYSGGSYKNDVWKSSDGVTWTEVTGNAQFSARSRHSVVEFNNELYLIGGDISPSFYNDVWKSSDGATWTEVTTTQSKFSGRRNHSVVKLNNELYLIGGDISPSFYNDVWKSSNGIDWKQKL